MQNQPIAVIAMSVRKHMTAIQIRNILEDQFALCTIRDISFGKLYRGFKQATVYISGWHKSNDQNAEILEMLFWNRSAMLFYAADKYWMISVKEISTDAVWRHQTRLLKSQICNLDRDLRETKKSQELIRKQYDCILKSLSVPHEDDECNLQILALRAANAKRKKCITDHIRTISAIKIQSLARSFMTRQRIFIKLYDELLEKSTCQEKYLSSSDYGSDPGSELDLYSTEIVQHAGDETDVDEETEPDAGELDAEELDAEEELDEEESDDDEPDDEFVLVSKRVTRSMAK